MLKTVKIYYTAGSTAMYFEINKQILASQTDSTLVTLNTATATTPTYASATRTFPTTGSMVNMAQDAYSACVCPSGSTTFTGLTITYTG